GISSLITSSKWVAHTHEVLSHASSLSKSMVDMETGQRGFMLTGNENFLEPYNSGQKIFDENIDSAKNQVSDNPEQVKRFEQVAELKEQWLKNAGKQNCRDQNQKREDNDIPSC
ncbi:MAG TPA: CHASE3 domain-containing protein, partial [Chitinispirillaceae bacterium]|nr:CHASE3 domain-containing protein [Chitinispirillaceae bacterium]